MSMKKKTRQLARRLAFVGAFSLATFSAFGSGSDYPDHQPVIGAQIARWPAGMRELVDSPERVHGFWENEEEVFFFAGTTTNFSEFLQAYSRISGIEKHCLILHGGTLVAKSPWATNGPPGDWQVYGCPKGWHNLGTLAGTNSAADLRKAVTEPGYILEVHFWTGGRIALAQVSIPGNIEVRRDGK